MTGDADYLDKSKKKEVFSMALAGPAVLMFFVYIGLIGISIYALVLFIMLAKRGIKALDIYINEKTNSRQ